MFHISVTSYLFSFVVVMICMDVLFHVYVCVSVYVTCRQVPLEDRRKGQIDPFELKLQLAMSLPTWVLRSKLSSSGRVGSTLHL